MRSARSGLQFSLAVTRKFGLTQGKRAPCALTYGLQKARTYAVCEAQCQGKLPKNIQPELNQAKKINYENLIQGKLAPNGSPLLNQKRKYSNYDSRLIQEKRVPNSLIQEKRAPNSSHPRIDQRRKYSGYENGLVQEKRAPNGSPVLVQGKRAPNSSLAGLNQKRNYAADCEKDGGKKKSMTVCQAPPNEPKVIPPYEYGFCKECDPLPPVGCPKKTEKKQGGPCCKSSKASKGGCRG